MILPFPPCKITMATLIAYYMAIFDWLLEACQYAPMIACVNHFNAFNNVGQQAASNDSASWRQHSYQYIEKSKMPSIRVDSPRNFRRIQNDKRKFMAKGASDRWLSEQLTNGIGLLILDCRPYSEFARLHITGAINLAIPSLMLRRLKKGTNFSVTSLVTSEEGKSHFTNNLSTASRIVLYDSTGQDVTSVGLNSALGVLLKKFSEDVKTPVCLLEGGFSKFEESNAKFCVPGEEVQRPLLSLSGLTIRDDNQLSTAKQEPCTPLGSRENPTSPVEILPYLYLGSEKHASDLENLRRFGIYHVLNVTHDKPNAFEQIEGFCYKKLPVEDNWKANLTDLFPEAFAFIDEGRNSKKGVLVHCLAGVSRSVTVTIAYLMSTCRMTLNEAYDFVKDRKSNVSPNFNFMGQLLDFERQLRTPKTPSSTTSSTTSSLSVALSSANSFDSEIEDSEFDSSSDSV